MVATGLAVSNRLINAQRRLQEAASALASAHTGSGWKISFFALQCCPSWPGPFTPDLRGLAFGAMLRNQHCSYAVAALAGTGRAIFSLSVLSCPSLPDRKMWHCSPAGHLGPGLRGRITGMAPLRVFIYMIHFHLSKVIV